MRSSWIRVRAAAADALTLYLLPAFVALLPWSIGFRLLKAVARRDKLYRLAVEPAWAAAQHHLPNGNEREFKERFRLLRLVDQTDTYLTLLRGQRWWRRQIDQHGDWPAAHEGAHVFLTYHWGAGHWVWRGLREHGFDAYFLARRAQGRALGATRLSHWYGRFRAWAIRRIGSRGPWFVGGSRDDLARELQTGARIVGMLDLPPTAAQRSVDASLLDARARFPSGLVDLAVQARARITLFSAGLDTASGRRRLWIEDLPAGLAEEDIMRRYVAHLDLRLRESPEFWQIWREAPHIFQASGDTPPQAL